MGDRSALGDHEQQSWSAALATEVQRLGGGVSDVVIGPDTRVEVLARLPFALPTDSRVHGFEVPDREFAPEASAYWRQSGSPLVFIQTLTIDAPWAQLGRPGLLESFSALKLHEHPPKVATGERGKSPAEEPPPQPLEGALDTWLCAQGAAAPLVGQSDPVEAVLELGVYGLNRLIRAVRLIRHGASIRPVSIEDFEMLCFARLIAQDDSVSEFAMHPLRVDWHPFALLLTPEENATVDSVVDMQGQYHPFLLYRDWFERANYAYQHAGDLVSAIVSLQTAVESLMLNLLRMLLIDEGRTSSELSLLYADPPAFAQLLTGNFHQRLGGSWATDRGAVGEYWKHLYQLRNRVVHGGHTPTAAEVHGAFRAYSRLMEHVVARLHANAIKFPRTFLSLVGIDGIERRGWATKRLRRIMDELSAEGPAIWLPADVAGRD